MDTEEIKRFLQVILVEQFIITGVRSTPLRTILNLEVVHALLGFGIDFPLAALPRPKEVFLNEEKRLERGNQASFALNILVRHIQGEPLEVLRCKIKALQLLIDHVAKMTRFVLRDAVQSEGTNLLEFLIPYVDDLAKEGRDALAGAVICNRLDVVQLLFRVGVDMDAEVRRVRTCNHRKIMNHRISILAHALQYCDPEENPGEVVKILVSHGATFRLSKKKPHPSDLLRFLLGSAGGVCGPSLLSVRYVVEQGLERQDPLILSSSMLELCYLYMPFRTDETARRAAFLYLFRKGACVRRGGVLAAWILLDGSTEIVRGLLDAGAGIECCLCFRWIDETNRRLTPLQAAAQQGNEEVVSLLLEAGADVNVAAYGSCPTALQAICSFLSNTPGKHEKKTRIVKLLLNKDANLNAAPARHSGFTALQMTARKGELDITMLLLQRGADVNAPPSKSEGYPNALDGAAMCGRLDMAKLLLNANALSQFRGVTGYDGAIRLAEINSHSAVVDLIRQHAAENQSDEGLRNPHLSSPPRDWHEYEDEWNRAGEYDGYTSDSEDDSSSSSESSCQSDSEDEEASDAPDHGETVSSAKRNRQDCQDDVTAEAHENALAAVDQNFGYLSEDEDFDCIAPESVWTGATNSVTRGHEHMGGHVIEELDVSRPDPVLLGLNYDDTLMAWEPLRQSGGLFGDLVGAQQVDEQTSWDLASHDA